MFNEQPSTGWPVTLQTGQKWTVFLGGEEGAHKCVVQLLDSGWHGVSQEGVEIVIIEY